MSHKGRLLLVKNTGGTVFMGICIQYVCVVMKV